MSGQGEMLARLAATIAARAGADPASSWTARLLAAGPEACARKFGEEAIEAVIAALAEDPERLAAEAADALYHLLVLCQARGVTLAAIEAELARREGRSGIEEKAGRAG
jgi:phosphoribosyl-ATP pyrophosphohydrolase